MFQCFSHRYLGWKINVLDSCDVQPEASAPEPSLALPDDQQSDGDLKSSPSILIETRVKPNDLFQTPLTKPAIKPEDRPQNDNPDITTQSPIQVDTTEKETDITYIVAETIKDDNLNTGEILPENLTDTLNDNSDINQQTPIIHEQPPEPQKNNKDSLDMTSLMFPAGRLPLEPQFDIPRRPVIMHRPYKPVYMPLHRPHHNFKKHFYRTSVRRTPIPRPIPHIHSTSSMQNTFALTQETNNMQNTFALTQEPVLMLPPPKGYLNVSSTTPLSGSVTASTTTDLPKMKPAVNTGFHPESVIIEGGFIPIITKELEERISEDAEEPADEIGVIRTVPENETPQTNSQTLTETFEPMFIPSPLDNHAPPAKKPNYSSKFSKRRFQQTKKIPSNMVVILKEGRSKPDDVMKSDDGDPMVMAAEKIQSYYLPPDDRKIKPVSKVQKPSNIDIPPGQVVTYDGKTVSGVSLTAPVSHTGNFETRSSKTSNLHLTPQFGPFRGEKPPLNPSSVNIASIVQGRPHASLNRDLSAPSSSKTTKLTAVRYRRSTEDFEDVIGTRIERSAHHTPEHTAQQKRQFKKQTSAKKFINSRQKRNPHHTPEHTAEQKRDSKKLAPGKKFLETHPQIRRTRSSHHNPQHTQEQKRFAAKQSKKFVNDDHKRTARVSRSAHHTSEHTAEQKRDSRKQSKKYINFQQASNPEQIFRVVRSPHHTPEHTAQQKKEKIKTTPDNPDNTQKRTKRSPHHTPEHSAQQKREFRKVTGKKVKAEIVRVTRSAHHTPEHTAEQMRQAGLDHHDHSHHNHTEMEAKSNGNLLKPIYLSAVFILLTRFL